MFHKEFQIDDEGRALSLKLKNASQSRHKQVGFRGYKKSDVKSFALAQLKAVAVKSKFLDDIPDEYLKDGDVEGVVAYEDRDGNEVTQIVKFFKDLNVVAFYDDYGGGSGTVQVFTKLR